MARDETLSIGEVAAQAGVSISAIRFYERRGLLPEAERVAGRRRFPAATVGRLGVIRTAQGAGLSLTEIGHLLAATDAGSPVREPLREIAAAKLPEAAASVAQAEARRDWLTAAGACACHSLEECALLA